MTAPLDQALARLRDFIGEHVCLSRREADLVLDALAQAERERDEAKTFVAATIAAHPHVLEQEAELVAVRQERDEALTELGEVSAQLVKDYAFVTALEAAEAERDKLREALRLYHVLEPQMDRIDKGIKP